MQFNWIGWIVELFVRLHFSLGWHYLINKLMPYFPELKLHEIPESALMVTHDESTWKE